MDPAIQRLLDEASKLSPEAREVLREGLRLLDEESEAEDPAEVEKAWIEEVRRRRAEADAGREKSISWDEAMERIDKPGQRDDSGE